MRALIAGLTAVFFLAGFSHAQLPKYYTKKSSWQETMKASREAEFKATGYGLNGEVVQAGDWYIVEAFRSDKPYKTVFEPEKDAGLDRIYPGGQRWGISESVTEGKVTFFTPGEGSALYLSRIYTSTANLDYPICMAGWGMYKIWLNKELVTAEPDYGEEFSEL